MRKSKPSASKVPPQPKTSKPVPRPKKKPSPASAPSIDSLENENDIRELESFCAKLSFVDISLSEWEHGFEHLDIKVPIWITQEVAVTGGERLVEFTRTIRRQSGTAPVREKAQLLIQIPRGCPHLAKISIQGKGDIRGGQAGDLIVIIHLKV